jgi:hypothetical protein
MAKKNSEKKQSFTNLTGGKVHVDHYNFIYEAAGEGTLSSFVVEACLAAAERALKKKRPEAPLPTRGGRRSELTDLASAVGLSVPQFKRYLSAKAIAEAQGKALPKPESFKEE